MIKRTKSLHAPLKEGGALNQHPQPQLLLNPSQPPPLKHPQPQMIANKMNNTKMKANPPQPLSQLFNTGATGAQGAQQLYP